jgi:hypothetical protein
MQLAIHNDDNLAMLERLAAAGEKFDLIELDGPYGAGLEGWDVLDEDALLAHYTARLPLVARLLQPWGVSFLFGYPEGCAEIKAWARQTGTLHLRRWLTWYKQRTAHKGRKCETVLVFNRQAIDDRLLCAFGGMLRMEREQKGWTLRDLGRQAGREWWHRGGNFYFETGRNPPSLNDYETLKNLFGFSDEWDAVTAVYEDITNLDFMSASYPEDTRDLNDAGLRSKPVGLYTDLFRPVVPPRETKRALVLYGGSGNAAIAAGKLGYDVDCVEQDAARCEMIRRRWAWQVERRDETPVEELGPLFQFQEAI